MAATGALSGAAAIAPGFGTALAVGTITTQAVYALEQEIELVLGIAMIFGHELKGSDERILEALVVVGITSGAVKLREDVLVAGGERIAVSMFRKLPLLLEPFGQDLLQRGFKFVGSTICYSLMQAAGLVNDHAVECFRHAEVAGL